MSIIYVFQLTYCATSEGIGMFRKLKEVNFNELLPQIKKTVGYVPASLTLSTELETLAKFFLSNSML